MEEQATVRESDILLRDPYHVANDTFSERRQSAWSALKLDAIKEAFGYPDEYQVDRDIVHQIAFDSARARGQRLEPVTVADLVHDLGDVSRFDVERPARTEALIDQLLVAGLPGIIAFYDTVAEVAGLKPITRKLPNKLMLGLAWAFETYADRVTHKPPPITYKAARYAQRKLWFDCSKAHNQLGMPRTPLRETIEKAVRWFRANEY